MNIANLSAKQLHQAARIREKIDSLQKDLARILGPETPAAVNVPKKKRHMSAAARKRISDAQKARWAKFKARK